MKPTLTIVIPTRNRREVLLQTLDSLLHQRADPDSFRIIVVADGCTDGTPEAVRLLAETPEWKGRDLGCIEQERAGASAARNTGLRAATSEIVLLLDDDITANRELVAAHMARHAMARENVVAIGRIVPERGTESLQRQLHRAFGNRHRRLLHSAPRWTDLYTGNVSFPRQSVMSVGGLDEALFYGEDVELGYRLHRLGVRFIYAPKASGFHRDLKPAPSLLRDFYRSGEGSARIYRKWPDTLPMLAISAYGDTSLRLRVVRGLLLRAAEIPLLEMVINWCMRRWASSRMTEESSRPIFELARSYYIWRGIRSQVGSRREWAMLTNPGTPVLMYHSVQPRRQSGKERFSMSKRRFALQMLLLKALRFRVVSLESCLRCWERGKLPPARSVAITFDDGYRDNLSEAWPVLRRFGYPATLFFVTGLAGLGSIWEAGGANAAKSLLGWREVARLDREGFRVESHTLSHPHLPQLSLEQAEYELRESRRQLEEKLERPVGFLAYPYGESNPTIERLAAESGYRAALTANRGLNTLRTGRYALKRTEISGGDNLFMFVLKVWLGEDPFHQLRKMVSRVGKRGNTR